MRVITEIQQRQYVEVKLGQLVLHLRPLRTLYLTPLYILAASNYGGGGFWLIFFATCDLTKKADIK